MSPKRIALVAIIIASLLWSTAGVGTKILLREFDPFPLAFLRFFVASLIMLPFFLQEKHKSIITMAKDTAPIALLLTSNIIFYYFGMQKTSVNASAILYAGAPFVVATTAHFLLGDYITFRKIFAIAIGFIGVTTILILPILEKGEHISGDFLGNLVIVIAVISFSMYTVGSRYLMNVKHYSAITITSMSLFVTMIVTGICTVFSPSGFQWIPLLHPQTFIIFLHMAILVTVVTYLLYEWAIEFSSPLTASFNIYLQTVFSILLAVVILNESLTAGFIGGSALVFIGLMLAMEQQAQTYIAHHFGKLLKIFQR